MLKQELCDYCDTEPARYYFYTAKKWCCEKHFNKCPHFRKFHSERMKENMKNSPRHKMIRSIERGEQVCVICGREAKFISKYNNDPICSGDTKKQCPDFPEHLSEMRKENYRNKPELIEKMRQVALDVHNRPEVKEKKRDKMLNLHHGDCDKCVSFQENFEEGHRNRRGKKNKRSRNALSD